MPIVHSIRKWLRESPHSPTPQESNDGIEAPPLRSRPILEIHVYRSYTQNNGKVTTIYYSDLGWEDMSKEAALASARILQCEIFAAYKAFLSNSAVAVPYLHIGDIVIQFADITAIRAVVGWRKP